MNLRGYLAAIGFTAFAVTTNAAVLSPAEALNEAMRSEGTFRHLPSSITNDSFSLVYTRLAR